jgi:hypothetical protein
MEIIEMTPELKQELNLLADMMLMVDGYKSCLKSESEAEATIYHRGIKGHKMKLSKNILNYVAITLGVIVIVFIAYKLHTNFKIKAMKKDIVYAIAYSKDLNSRGEIKGRSTSLKGANTGQLLTNIIGTATVNVKEDSLGGSLTITFPNVGAYYCPHLVKEFNRFMEANCQNETLVLYGI